MLRLSSDNAVQPDEDPLAPPRDSACGPTPRPSHAALKHLPEQPELEDADLPAECLPDPFAALDMAGLPASPVAHELHPEAVMSSPHEDSVPTAQALTTVSAAAPDEVFVDDTPISFTPTPLARSARRLSDADPNQSLLPAEAIVCSPNASAFRRRKTSLAVPSAFSYRVRFASSPSALSPSRDRLSPAPAPLAAEPAPDWTNIAEATGFSFFDATQRFVFGRTLGTGACARVVAAHDLLLQEDVAVKVISRSAVPSAHDALQEYALCRDLHHPNVIRVLDCIVRDTEVLMVQEMAPCGDLFEQILPGVGATIGLTFSVLNQLVSALEYLQTVGIVHCDIKPENIVLDAAGNAKLCDFGLAERVGTMMAGGPGTGSYMAPEIVYRRIFSGTKHPIEHSLDMWSLGVLFFNMLVGKKPWVSSDQIVDKYYHAYRSGTHVVDPPWCLFAPQLHFIFARLFSAEPSSRCSLGELRHFLTFEWPQAVPNFVFMYTVCMGQTDPSAAPNRVSDQSQLPQQPSRQRRNMETFV
eukprot:m.192584 g.192584  ORF g.192584 m.192584 type:complete len:527 (+) comp53665_c0_seq1:760-2340(+)